ncbi:hypothetical protein HY626_01725 [Candidatus Uhrbacteria bacterium]|nr:hypothetical protein [Candidatus Uhrbacteria bacterium]
MSRSLLVSLLPLAFVVGCGNSTGGTCAGAECDATDVDSDFSAMFHNVAPYGWVGDHLVWPYDENSMGIEPLCSSVNECNAELSEFGTRMVDIDGDTFMCVPQLLIVGEVDDGTTVDATSPWLGEGMCGLAPEGEDDGWEVRTDIHDLNSDGDDEVIIHIASWTAIVTGSEFFYEEDEYLLEGWISEDLSQVYFHRVVETGETERTLDL